MTAYPPLILSATGGNPVLAELPSSDSLLADVTGDIVGGVNISGINIPVIGSPNTDTLEELLRGTESTGIIKGGDITLDGDGTITVTSGEGLIRSTNDDTGVLLAFDFEASAIDPVDDATLITYIWIEYNNGSPQFATNTTGFPTDHNSNVLIGTVHRDGIYNHQTPRIEHVGNFAHSVNEHFLSVDGIRRASGGIVSETGARYLQCTQADLWVGLNEITSHAGGFDSSGSDTYFNFYRDGAGGWNLSLSSQVDNTQYDDGTGTLATLTNNRYGVHWVYIGVDDHIYVIYGRGDYLLAGAEAATPPADLPPHMQELHAILAAKIIVKRDDTNFTSIESAFVEKFTTAGVAASHNDLADLGDNDHPQYFLSSSADTSFTDVNYNIDDLSSIQLVHDQSINNLQLASVDLYASAAEYSDHGNLDGLADDDHPQYLTNARGDGRYYQTSDAFELSGTIGLSGATAAATAAISIDTAETVWSALGGVSGTLSETLDPQRSPHMHGTFCYSKFLGNSSAAATTYLGAGVDNTALVEVLKSESEVSGEGTFYNVIHDVGDTADGYWSPTESGIYKIDAITYCTVSAGGLISKVIMVDGENMHTATIGSHPLVSPMPFPIQWIGYVGADEEVKIRLTISSGTITPSANSSITITRVA